MNGTIQESKPLSDIIGAADLSDFVCVVESVSATSPVLQRGDVVAKLADGNVTLAGAEATTAAAVYGILLDGGVDPTKEGGATATIARSGVYDATQLRVDPAARLADFADQLRIIGIFLEKLNLVQ